MYKEILNIVEIHWSFVGVKIRRKKKGAIGQSGREVETKEFTGRGISGNGQNILVYKCLHPRRDALRMNMITVCVL